MFEIEDKYKDLPHYLSLGAGVQSSTLALMYATGEIGPMPKAAIFADTLGEPASVYEWLDWLKEQLPFPLHVVSKGSLEEAALTMRTTKDGRKFSSSDIPFFTRNADGTIGKIPNRSCTADYKIKPILKTLRKIVPIKRGEKEVRCVSIIGISLDEIRRMKPSREKWVAHRWPLIELRWTRQRCHQWMADNGFPDPPRSACVYCPFHDSKEWRRMQLEEPEEFDRAVKFEKDLQRVKGDTDNMHAVPFLHRSCVPLEEIDFRSDIERGQMTFWDDECEGMCGV